MVTYEAAEEIKAALAKEVNLESTPRAVSTLGDKKLLVSSVSQALRTKVPYSVGECFNPGRKNSSQTGTPMFQCYAEYIRWCRRLHGERRTRRAPAPASLMYQDAALPLVRSP